MTGPAAERPFPPGDYGVVVVGSGPGGLQVGYLLERAGIRHAVLSRDTEPGGMFRLWPIYQRLLSWTKPDAPCAHGTREYEWFDHNSLLGDEPAHRAAIVPHMDRAYMVPSRTEMEAGLASFASWVSVRYGCAWTGTRREDDGRLVLETTDGEYRCRAAVFALGVTEPWRSSIPGVEQVPHYAEARPAHEYEGRDVLVIGKRNSGFELADGLLPWARRITLVSPRPVQASVLALSSVRVRYLQPYEDAGLGGGTLALDAAIESVERDGDRWRVRAQGTTHPGPLELDADDVIAATGFRTPLLDLERLGVMTVGQGRIPALSPWWEAIGAPGVYFAGNATQGAPGLRRHGVGASSPAVHGFRYNARLLVRQLARTLGREAQAPEVPRERLVDLLLTELTRAPELWAQKGYLARSVLLEGAPCDDGVVPLQHVVDDESGCDAVAVAVEMDAAGTIFPGIYVRRGGRTSEHHLEPDPLHEYRRDRYRAELERLLEEA